MDEADNGDNDVAKMHTERKETRSPKERAQDTYTASHTREREKKKIPYSMSRGFGMSE